MNLFQLCHRWWKEKLAILTIATGGKRTRLQKFVVWFLLVELMQIIDQERKADASMRVQVQTAPVWRKRDELYKLWQIDSPFLDSSESFGTRAFDISIFRNELSAHAPRYSQHKFGWMCFYQIWKNKINFSFVMRNYLLWIQHFHDMGENTIKKSLNTFIFFKTLKEDQIIFALILSSFWPRSNFEVGKFFIKWWA